MKKTWTYVAWAIPILICVGFFACGLIAFTPLGSVFGRRWQYNGGMGVGRISPFPNQSAIAYSSSHFGTSHIYTVSWSGNTIRQLTNDARGDSDACVSPNGRFIAFARQDADRVHLWLMNADGTGQRQLTFGTGCQTEPSFSPGGGKIAYVESDPAAGSYAVAVMNANGTKQTILTSGSTQVQDTTPAFDPTGTTVYFSRYEFNGSGRMEVWAINTTGKGEWPIGFGNHPAVSPNGRQIVFLDEPQNQMLGIMKTNGTGRNVIGQNMDYGSCLRYCPDGQHILLSTSKENEAEIWLISTSGIGRQKIATVE